MEYVWTEDFWTAKELTDLLGVMYWLAKKQR